MNTEIVTPEKSTVGQRSVMLVMEQDKNDHKESLLIPVDIDFK